MTERPRVPEHDTRAHGSSAVLHALVIASVLLPLVIFGVAAWQNWRHLEAQAAGRAERHAALVAEHAAKVFQSSEQVLRRIEERVRTLSWEEIAASREVSDFLEGMVGELRHLRGAGLIAPDGRLAAVTGSFPAPRIDLSDREYFLDARHAPGVTHVSRIITDRVSTRTFFRLARRDGGEGGVIFASLSPDYFTDFYSTITLGEDAVTMAREDGAVLARDPPVTTGSEILSPTSGFMRGIQRSDTGLYRTVSELDRLDRIHAYRRVGDYPVFVSYGFSLRVLDREWRANLATFGAVSALAALALLALSLFALRTARTERRLFAEHRAEVRRREEAEARLRQSQKMEALGQLTGGVAHDFNNLLTVVIGSLSLLEPRMEQSPPRDQRLVQGAMEAARRAATLTQRLLAFARRQPLAPSPLDVNRLVTSMSEMLRRTLGERVEIETVLGGGLWRALADRNELENAILNLAVNARDAMPEGGRLTIETANAALDEAYAARQSVEPGQYVLISISDTGSGMTREVMEHAFEPFFTTKPVGSGTGLGLSQVHGFLRQSGGHVGLYSEPGEGTTVRLYLPRHRGPEVTPTDEDPAREPPPRARGGEQILVVEDDEGVRRFSVEALREAGYEVVEAGDGEAGLEALARHPDIDLLFTDVVLPGALNGRQLADLARQRRPGLKVVFTTGYTRNAIIHHGRLDPGVHLVSKPFTPAELARKLAEVLEGRG